MPAAKKQNVLAEVEQELNVDEILKGVPKLLPPEKFRQRQRSDLMKLVATLSDVTDEDGGIDPTDPEVFSRFLDLVAGADEFFESIAFDKEAYAAWSEGLKDSEQTFGVLLAKYGAALGE